MITFLTPLRPDEMLISFVARQKYFTHSNLSDTFRDLFDTTQIKINSFLPNVNQLNITALRDLNLSKEDILSNNTLYPLYKLSVTTSSKHHNALNGKFEINYRHLKFCSQCIKEDRLSIGESYWHRVHNIPGIIVCSKHNTLLNTWTTPLKDIAKRSLFSLDEVVPEPPHSKENHNEDLFEFTRRVTNALFEQNPPSKKDIIEKSLKCGLLTHVGKRVEVQFKKFSELIQNLFQAINIYPGTNFRRIKAALSVANKFCDPLTLIAIELICERIQKTTVLEPECPQVPCVNKLCSHYKTSAKITSEFHELNHCKTEGLIQKCTSCGHSIIFNIRRGKQLYVVDYGHVILANIIDSVKGGQSYLSISRKLKIDRKRVSKLFTTNSSIAIDIKSNDNMALINRRRKFWKQYLKTNQVENLSKLTGVAKTVYRFLQKNDSLWLVAYNKETRLRKGKSTGRPTSSFNDEQVVEMLAQTKKSLIDSDIPRRVSKQLLLHSIQMRGLTAKKLADLPQTLRFLKDECETPFQWKKRKIRRFVLNNRHLELTTAKIMDKFKAYKNTKTEKEELKEFIAKLLIA